MRDPLPLSKLAHFSCGDRGDGCRAAEEGTCEAADARRWHGRDGLLRLMHKDIFVGRWGELGGPSFSEVAGPDLARHHCFDGRCWLATDKNEHDNNGHSDLRQP
jgi:hypothetical protein